jgi:hypothetical protein
MPDSETVSEYREAYETWQKHLSGLHAFMLEGQRLDPIRIKGLLNREARAKRRYDQARLKLLGIEDEGDLIDDADEGDEES